MSELDVRCFAISGRVSTISRLNECSFGKQRYRGTWKRAQVEVLDVFDLVENHEEFSELFLEAMTNMNKIRHPNVAQVFGICLGDEQSLRIVTELLTVTLSDRLSRGGPMILSDRTRVLYEVLNGLRFLHESNSPVIHGLLTTDSVWLSRDLSQVKIAHICTARLLVEKGRPHCFESVQQCLAPEVLEDRSTLSMSSDIFSYGVLVLETITGRSGRATEPCGHEEPLWPVISECRRSAGERPTAKELMSYFPSPSTDVTFAVKKMLISAFLLMKNPWSLLNLQMLLGCIKTKMRL